MASTSGAQKINSIKNTGPTLSLKMNFSGDITESYQFSGVLGAKLTGETEKPDPVCENTSTFQYALFREKKSLEVWLVLKCTIEGQKLEYRPQRFFIDPTLPTQSVEIPSLSLKLKKIMLQIAELKLKTKKLKK